MYDADTIESWYVDQAYKPGMNWMYMTDFYTPDGIKQLDSEFCHRILAFQQGKSYTKYSWNHWSPYSDEPKREPRREVEMVWTDTLASLSKDIIENPIFIRK
jgi:hypothetical protein